MNGWLRYTMSRPDKRLTERTKTIISLLAVPRLKTALKYFFLPTLQRKDLHLFQLSNLMGRNLIMLEGIR